MFIFFLAVKLLIVSFSRSIWCTSLWLLGPLNFLSSSLSDHWYSGMIVGPPYKPISSKGKVSHIPWTSSILEDGYQSVPVSLNIPTSRVGKLSVTIHLYLGLLRTEEIRQTHIGLIWNFCQESKICYIQILFLKFNGFCPWRRKPVSAILVWIPLRGKDSITVNPSSYFAQKKKLG